MELRLEVPQSFCNPIPPEWTERDTSLVLHVGTAAVKLLKSEELPCGDVQRDLAKREFFDELQVVLGRQRNDCDVELHRLRSQLTLERQESAAERERAGARLDAARSALQLEKLQMVADTEASVRLDVQNLERIERQRLEEMATSTEAQLRAERAEFARSTGCAQNNARERDDIHAAERMRLCDQVASLTAELSDREARLCKLSVASNKGNAIEAELRQNLSALGMHVYDTSKGKHNTHYHDMLVALCPLVPGVAIGGFPTYSGETPEVVRCCVEWKGHSRSGGLSKELEKFAAVRRCMLEEGTAECFCFAAQATIPGQRRHHFEITSGARLRPTVTSYVGSSEVTDVEVALTVHFTILLQSKLSESDLQQQPQSSNELDALVVAANTALDKLRQCVERCEEMERLATAMNIQIQRLREGIVDCALAQVRPLSKMGRLDDGSQANEFLLALGSLAGDKRRTGCKILKTKAQFASAQNGGGAAAAEDVLWGAF
jgi:hypothetical protein